MYRTNHINMMTSYLKGEKKFRDPEDVPTNCFSARTVDNNPDDAF